MHMLPTLVAYRTVSLSRRLRNTSDLSATYDFHVLRDGKALVKGFSWQLDGNPSNFRQ